MFGIIRWHTYCFVGVAVASWLVRLSLGRAARVRTLVGVIALCS